MPSWEEPRTRRPTKTEAVDTSDARKVLQTVGLHNLAPPIFSTAPETENGKNLVAMDGNGDKRTRTITWCRMGGVCMCGEECKSNDAHLPMNVHELSADSRIFFYRRMNNPDPKLGIFMVKNLSSIFIS